MVLICGGDSLLPNFCIDGLIECDSNFFCMIRPNFLTTADRLELLSCVKYHREDHGVARRANALLLLRTGMSYSQIAKVLLLDDDTVRSWHKQYLAEDWEAVARSLS